MYTETTEEITRRRMREAMDEQGISYRELGDLTGITYSTLQRYATGVSGRIPSARVTAIARALHVNPMWLMALSEDKDGTHPTGRIRPIGEDRRIPVIGRIACGSPMLAEENVRRYEYTDDDSVDFALDVVGDSMVDAGINNGDTVYIHAQDDVENGEIGAVIIDDEATLKRVYHNGSIITLEPCNERYRPISYRAGQADIRIVGKAVGLRRRF